MKSIIITFPFLSTQLIINNKKMKDISITCRRYDNLKKTFFFVLKTILILHVKMKNNDNEEQKRTKIYKTF